MIFLMIKLIIPEPRLGAKNPKISVPEPTAKEIGTLKACPRGRTAHKFGLIMKIFIVLLAALAATGSLSAQNQPDSPADAKEAMAAAAEFMKAFQGGSNSPFAAMGGKPAVDFRELKALLPEQLAGLPRTEASGKKTGAFGVNVSTAEARYGGKEDGPQINLKITDMGAMGPLGAMAGLGWMSTDIDSESDNGYERTVDYKGNKGLEKYSTESKSGTATTMVGGRFMIEIEGQNIEPAQLKTAAEAFDYDALDRLAKRPQVE